MYYVSQVYFLLKLNQLLTKLLEVTVLILIIPLCVILRGNVLVFTTSSIKLYIPIALLVFLYLVGIQK